MGKVNKGCGGCLTLCIGFAVLSWALVKTGVVVPKPAPVATLQGNAAASKPTTAPEAHPTSNPPPLDHDLAVEAQREAAPIAPIPTASPVTVAKPHLPTTISSLRGWFERADFVFRSAPLADGRPRLLGQPPDKLTTAELIGTGDVLEEAEITIGVVRDDSASLIRNTGIVMMFMRETGWPGGEKWAFDAMLKKDPPPKVNGTVSYKVTTVMRESGVFFVSADPVGAAKPADN